MDVRTGASSRLRTTCAGLALVVAGSLMPQPIAAQTGGHPVGPDLQLKVATTKRKIKAFGTFVGDRKAGRVRLALVHDGDVNRKRVPLQDDGYFIGGFARPETGDCRVRATYIAADDRIRRRLDLPCERPNWGTGEATLVDNDTAKTMTIDIEIADSGEERSYGLMYRKWLHPEKGMAFVYPGTTSGGYWMANCLIPLSIAFYDSTGEIVSILDMDPCEPQGSTDCPTYDPGVPYQGSLEVNKNHFDVWNIEVGDRIIVSPGP